MAFVRCTGKQREMQPFNQANPNQLRRLLKILDHYEHKPGGPYLDFFLCWVEDEHPPAEYESTEKTIRYWEQIMSDPGYELLEP
jgi:hypothetical protein